MSECSDSVIEPPTPPQTRPIVGLDKEESAAALQSMTDAKIQRNYDLPSLTISDTHEPEQSVAAIPKEHYDEGSFRGVYIPPFKFGYKDGSIVTGIDMGGPYKAYSSVGRNFGMEIGPDHKRIDL